jgi:hypothetical protein
LAQKAFHCKINIPNLSQLKSTPKMAMLSTFKLVKFLCRCEPKIATIDFGHFVGFCIDITKNFIKIRGSKLCLSHYLKIDQGELKYKIRYKFGKEYLRKETYLFQFEYINLKVLSRTKFSKRLGTIIIKPY